MFLQYHDIIKPAYLYAVLQMLITGNDYGFPIHILKGFSVLSIIEWYINRRYQNPLRCLDYQNTCDPKDLDELMLRILRKDPSIYKYSPILNIERMFHVYRKQHMRFPVYVYTQEEEPYVQKDCEKLFSGIDFKYLHGDLKIALDKCDQNFTYIFSDIEMVKNAVELLTGTCSHVLLAEDYRYNYFGNFKRFKTDLRSLMFSHPIIRLGTTRACDLNQLAVSMLKLYQGGK